MAEKNIQTTAQVLTAQATKRTTLETAEKSGFTEFYLGVLSGSNTNYFSPRNKFKISWGFAESVQQYKSTYKGAADYEKTAKEILEVLQAFRLHIDHIELPGMCIANGQVINDGRGAYYVQGDRTIAPERNEMDIYSRETQIAIVDLAYMWMEYNARPWIRPIKLNLYIDYYSDYDGKTSNMAYVVKNCRPIETDTIKALHDNREILLRKIGIGFDAIVPTDTMGTTKGTTSIKNNWNKLVKQLRKAQQETPSLWDTWSTSWKESKGFLGTTTAIASATFTGKSYAVDTSADTFGDKEWTFRVTQTKK
jgi:hypothetical protein